MALTFDTLGNRKPNEENKKERVIGYIDGFNLYYGIKSKGWKSYYWLNVHALMHKLLLPNQELVSVKYFTSRIRSPEAKRKRQATYLDAIGTVPGVQTFEGQFVDQNFTCPNCRLVAPVPAEKMTDVNIATHMMRDAFEDGFDSVRLITADSDLYGPIQTILELFPTKRVVVAFPPGRFSKELAGICSAYIHINKNHLSQSQFPDAVPGRGGFELRRPESWG
jgi:uncharacterized LabA/DUF88 family protein